MNVFNCAAFAAIASFCSVVSAQFCDPPIVDRLPVAAFDVALADGLLLAAGPAGLSVYALTGPGSPEDPFLLTTAPAPRGSGLNRVAADGDLAVVNNGVGGSGNTWIVDLSNPASPVFSEALMISGLGAFGTAAIEGDLVLVHFTTLSVPFLWDFSDFENPRDVIVDPDGALGVGLFQNVAYVFGGLERTLKSFDVSDPANPAPLDEIALPGIGPGSNWMAFENDRLYIRGTSEFGIVDIADPADMRLLGTPGIANSLRFDVAANLMYVSISNDAVSALITYDVSDPRFGIPLAVSDAPAPRGVAYLDGLVYLASLDVPVIDVAACASPPIITGQPASAIAQDGAPAVELDVEGTLIASYQWRRNGEPIVDGGPYSGATTAVLTVEPSAATEGVYDVIVSNVRGDIVSAQAVLAVTGGAPACPADFDGDGELTLFDFLAFQNAFDAGCP